MRTSRKMQAMREELKDFADGLREIMDSKTKNVGFCEPALPNLKELLVQLNPNQGVSECV